MCPGKKSRIDDKTLLCNWVCLEKKVKNRCTSLNKIHKKTRQSL